MSFDEKLTFSKNVHKKIWFVLFPQKIRLLKSHQFNERLETLKTNNLLVSSNNYSKKTF